MTDVQPPAPVTGATALAAADQRPTLVDLVRDAAQESTSIVRGEIDLAKAELRESAQKGGKGAGMVAGAAFLGFTAWFLITFAAAFGLVALGLPVWAGMLIVAVVYLLVAGVLGLLARREFQRIKGLERTQTVAKETIEEAKAALTPPSRP